MFSEEDKEVLVSAEQTENKSGYISDNSVSTVSTILVIDKRTGNKS